MSRLGAVSLLVRDYDEAIAFYVGALGFDLSEDTDMGGGKRWVRVGGRDGGELLLARATSPEQTAAVGKEAGGRVAFFVHTRAFDRDYARMLAAGVKFAETPRNEVYGRVVVFADLYGNRWDLIEARDNAVPDNGEI